jgi:hypothetical protein
MSRFIEGEQRTQRVLFPEQLEDWITEENPVRAVDAFVDEVDLTELGFAGAQPAATGRPAYHPATLLKVYIYGYLNRIQSSRRLEREAQRNVELVWLTGQLEAGFEAVAVGASAHGHAQILECSYAGRQMTGSLESFRPMPAEAHHHAHLKSERHRPTNRRRR